MNCLSNSWSISFKYGELSQELLLSLYSNLLDGRCWLPGLHLHHWNGRITAVVRAQYERVSAGCRVASDERVPPDGEAGDHGAAEHQRVSPSHPGADPGQLRPEGSEQPQHFLLLLLYVLQADGEVLVLAVFCLNSLHRLEF